MPIIDGGESICDFFCGWWSYRSFSSENLAVPLPSIDDDIPLGRRSPLWRCCHGEILLPPKNYSLGENLASFVGVTTATEHRILLGSVFGDTIVVQHIENEINSAMSTRNPFIYGGFRKRRRTICYYCYFFPWILWWLRSIIDASIYDDFIKTVPLNLWRSIQQ